jgi:sulfopyruvate decarboxylase TPP-binding subunit
MVCVLVRGLVGLAVVFLDVALLVLNTGLGEMIAALGSRGTTDHVFPLVVLVLLPWDMGSLVVSVRNVVPTLTSNKRQGLSLNGRC